MQEYQQQKDANVVLDDLKEKDGFLALRAAGVNVAEHEVGKQMASGLLLNDNELAIWASWVVDAPHAGIRNKPAFCAAKVRLGFSVNDVFPEIVRKRKVAENQSDQQRDIEREENRDFETAVRADKVILSMNPEERRALRAKALDDGAVWLARDLSLALLARVIRAAERTLALAETPVTTICRDHTAYKVLPPL